MSLHKKGSRTLCKNYLGIALLSIPGKVFAKDILNQLKPRAELSCSSVKASLASSKGVTIGQPTVLLADTNGEGKGVLSSDLYLFH